jgi:hypothetical protein
VFDFWAKIESGYLSSIGSRVNFGHFDNCLKFRHEISNSETIKGQHCLVTFTASESTLPEDFNGDFDWREM